MDGQMVNNVGFRRPMLLIKYGSMEYGTVDVDKKKASTTNRRKSMRK